MAKKAVTNSAPIDKSVSSLSSAAPKKAPAPAKKHLKSQAAGVAAAVEGFVQAIVGPTAQNDEKVEEVKVSPTIITENEIAVRAYELYLERGGQNGSQADDWLRAEQSLRASAK